MPNDTKKKPAKKKPAKKKAPAKRAAPQRQAAMGSPKPVDREPTSVSEWGKAAPAQEIGFVTELPSGNVARVRRSFDLLTLLKSGKIPNPLRSIIQKQISGRAEGGIVDMKALREEGGEEALMQMMDVLNEATVRIMVEPPVSGPAPRGRERDEVTGELVDPDETQEEYEARLEVWTPEPGTLSVFDIELQDKMFLFAVGQGVVADAKSFRQEQERTLAASLGGEGVRAEAKRPSGRRKRA